MIFLEPKRSQKMGAEGWGVIAGKIVRQVLKTVRLDTVLGLFLIEPA